eukprot:s183_g25.t1
MGKSSPVLVVLIAFSSVLRSEAWCDAAAGNCVGEVHNFEKRDLGGSKGGPLEDFSNTSMMPVANLVLRFADWDDDRNVDLLIGYLNSDGNFFQIDWRQRLPKQTVQIHELVKVGFFDTRRRGMNFQAVDWDGDKKLDLMLCEFVEGGKSEDFPSYSEYLKGGKTEVLFLNHSLLPMSRIVDVNYSEGRFTSLKSHLNVSAVLIVDGFQSCDMQFVDFDEDGDVDLFLGQAKYFERTSMGDLIERNENLIAMFNNRLLQIVDVNGDGHVEAVAYEFDPGSATSLNRIWSGPAPYSLRYFHRALDGRFVEPVENPLAGISFMQSLEDGDDHIYLVDWDSDGLVDVLKVRIKGDRYAGFSGFQILEFHQHVLNLDMAYNSHFTAYENLPESRQFKVIDWNKDGWDDVLVNSNGRLHLYQVKVQNVQKLVEDVQPFEHVRLWPWVDQDHMITVRDTFSVADWDGDGDLDLIVATFFDNKVHFFEMDSGRLKPEEEQHPFRNISLDGPNPEVWLVDWDNDGDVDLLTEEGRYFEQLADGTLRELAPSEQDSMFRSLSDLCGTRASLRPWCFANMQLVDCDGDGDFDLIRKISQYEFQICEHDNIAGIWRCDDGFACLGTTLSHASNSTNLLQKLGEHWEIGIASGRLKLFASHWRGKGIVHWTAGFCASMDPCRGNGACLPTQLNCQCFAGYELADCSRCEPLYYTVPSAEQFRNCQPCPGQGSNVCHGRGDCFDDASAQALAQHKIALTATGNGSCHCNEVYFNGSDVDNRSTCSDGSCPAGTEEIYGKCRPCPAGFYSLQGDSCKKCSLGTYSQTGSSRCLKCPRGSISKVQGASVCSPCPAGKFEMQGRWCSDCQPGFVSLGGNASCTPCEAGYVALKPGSITCEACAPGTFSLEDKSKCIPCRAGTAAGAASGTCLSCPPGSISATQGASTCEPCPDGTQEVKNLWCDKCPSGKSVSIETNFSCAQCPAGYVAPRPGSMKCEPCPSGRFSEGSTSCSQCPSGSIATSPGSAKCESCEGILIRAMPDAAKQVCQVDIINIVFAVASVIASTSLCFLCLLGWRGQVALADVSSQGEKLVITTAISHFLLTGSCPDVTFKDTAVPRLESGAWKVKSLNSIQLTLARAAGVSDPLSSMPVDTSIGHVALKFPSAFLHIGLWRCPLVAWCLLFVTANAAAMSQLTWSLMLVVSAVGIIAGSVAFAWRCRQGQRTPLFKRRRQFLTEWLLRVSPCDRGPDRSMKAGQLYDFVQFFEAFIKGERSMYYVCSNIVKPLTEPFQLSFVEVVGPNPMQWFVSHFWGMALRHFNDAIRKHAESHAHDWRESAYWICTFSNSQWHVKAELGSGEWQESSFYLALSSPLCKGTAMVIDEQVLPLQRIWCLFEVYHTIQLSRSNHFQGLLLCSSTGVLQEGHAGTDVAVRVAERAANLDTRSAGATAEEDRKMIHDLIEKMPGGFDAMNNFVREKICEALEASHRQHETTFRSLIRELTSKVAAAKLQAPLPTLLTGAAISSEKAKSMSHLPD